MEIVVSVIEGIMLLLSTLISALLVFQLALSLFGFKSKTKDYEDHDPQMRFLVLVPAHNEEAVIADIINNLNSMDYPRELYDFYILADNCTDRTAEIARGLGAKVLESHKDSPDAPTGKPIVLQKDENSDFAFFDLPEGCWRVFMIYDTPYGSPGDHRWFINMLSRESV